MPVRRQINSFQELVGAGVSWFLGNGYSEEAGRWMTLDDTVQAVMLPDTTPDSSIKALAKEMHLRGFTCAKKRERIKHMLHSALRANPTLVEESRKRKSYLGSSRP